MIKVWGMTLGTERLVVAAASQRQAAELMGVPLSGFRQFASTTGNEEEIQTCMANPGQVFSQPLIWRGPRVFVPIKRAPHRARKKASRRDDLPDHLKFGYAHHAERARIREHLFRRGRFAEMKDHRTGKWLYSAPVEFRITRIQQRIHRHDKTLAQRQAERYAKLPPPSGDRVLLTFAQIERLIEHFEGANDPELIEIVETLERHRCPR